MKFCNEFTKTSICMVEEYLLLLFKNQTCCRFGHVCTSLGRWEEWMDACVDPSCSATFHRDTGLVGQLLWVGWVGCCQGCKQGSFLCYKPILLEELLAEV